MAILARICMTLLAAFTGITSGDYQYYTIEESKKPFQEHAGIMLTSGQHYKETLGADDYRKCIRICDLEGVKCKSINIMKKGGLYDCWYRKVSIGKFKQRADAIYVSREAPVCSNYCTELEFMNLCGKCNCTETVCGSKFSHFCDCTKALTSAQKSCKDVRNAGFKDPAMYKFQNAGGTEYQGFCETREDPNVLWLTMLRRFNSKVPAMEHIQFVDGFGQPHDENYWLGLEQLYHFTKEENTILRVEVATHSHHFQWYGEYGDFKITKSGDTYSYTASDFRTKFCLGNAFVNSGAAFGKCEHNHWFGGCEFWTNPFRNNEVRWSWNVYQRITLLLRRGSLNPVTPLTSISATRGEKIETRKVATIPSLGPDWCISFNLYTLKAKIDNGYNILCLVTKSDPNECALTVMTSTSTSGFITFWAHEGGNWNKGDAITAPVENKWINIKISNIRRASGIYMTKTFVNDKRKTDDDSPVTGELKNVIVYTGLGLTKGKRDQYGVYDGRIDNLYINGKLYIGDGAD